MPEHPPKLKKEYFSMSHHVLWNLNFPVPYYFIIYNDLRHFMIFFKIFHFLAKKMGILHCKIWQKIGGFDKQIDFKQLHFFAQCLYYQLG